MGAHGVKLPIYLGKIGRKENTEVQNIESNEIVSKRLEKAMAPLVLFSAQRTAG
jgi:hypothetical protein